MRRERRPWTWTTDREVEGSAREWTVLASLVGSDAALTKTRAATETEDSMVVPVLKALKEEVNQRCRTHWKLLLRLLAVYDSKRLHLASGHLYKYGCCFFSLRLALKFRLKSELFACNEMQE